MKLEELNRAFARAREKKLFLEMEAEALSKEFNSIRTGFDGLQAEVSRSSE